MRLSEMRQLLEARGIRLTKSLGQNFLHDEHHLERIVAAAGVCAGDRVLEVGPGLGPLTERLLEAGAEVLAIERDERLVACLRERLGDRRGLELVHGDALEYVRLPSKDWSAWKVVSNLPYSIGTVILVELAGLANRPARMTVTLQREVVQRLVATQGSAAYGLLSLLVQAHYVAAGWFRIPPGCFFPEPDVESACVTLNRREVLLLAGIEEKDFVRVVKRAFSQRRKMMVKLLRSEWPESEVLSAYESLGIDRRARAEEVGLEQFVGLARRLGSARE